jgi:hypothetical protein
MQQVIALQFNYTEEEYVAATRLYLRRSTDFIIRLVVCVLYAFFCVGVFRVLDFKLEPEIILLFAFVAFLPFLIAFLHLFVVPRQRFRSDPKFRDQYLLQFSDDGIHFRTAQIDALLRWSLYNKVLEDERFYLLVYGKNMISVIPKRAFAGPAQEAAFRQLLGRRLPAHFDAKPLAAAAYVPPAEPPDWR